MCIQHWHWPALSAVMSLNVNTHRDGNDSNARVRMDTCVMRWRTVLHSINHITYLCGWTQLNLLYPTHSMLGRWVVQFIRSSLYLEIQCYQWCRHVCTKCEHHTIVHWRLWRTRVVCAQNNAQFQKLFHWSSSELLVQCHTFGYFPKIEWWQNESTECWLVK